MTFFHTPAFLHPVSAAKLGGDKPRLSWLDRLAMWSDRQAARPHHMGSYII